MTGHVALVCRNCGSPLDPRSVSTELRCPACGTVTPLEKRQASSLRAHAARIARGIQYGRTAVRGRIMAARLEQTSKRGALVFFAALFLMMGFVGAVIALFASMEGGVSGPMSRLLGVVFGFSILVMSALVLAVPCAAVYFYARHTTKQATRLARPVTANLQATMTTRCSQCGAQLPALTIGTDLSAPCPYCETPIAPPEGLRDIVQATLAAMADHERTAASTEMQQAMERISSKRSYEPKKLKGLSFEFAGAIATGSHDDVQMWAADDYLDASYMIRLEVDSLTGLGGSVWFVPHQVLETHWSIANELGVPFPTTRVSLGDQHIDTRFTVLVDGDVSPVQLVSEQGFRQMLFGFGPDESLLLDGAGLSFYRSGTFWKLTRSGGIPAFLKKHAPNAAWLVKAMARANSSP